MEIDLASNSTFSLINELIGHIVWPLVIVVFLFLFKGKIVSLFKAIKKLKFSDIEAEFEEREKEFAEQDISPLVDEIDGLNKRIEKLELEYKSLSNTEPIQEECIDDNEVNTLIIGALANGPYRWRSIPKLASISNLTEEQILKILRKDINVVISKGKSGRKIARLRNK